MARFCFIISGILGGFAVMLGAFAAHALKSTLTPELLDAFKTGVHYQLIHALALLGIGGVLLSIKNPIARKRFRLAALCFMIGSLLFSGSLYCLALTGFKWFGPITPIGGILFIVGWGCIISAALSITKEDTL
ncbi:DUF423 domain-containing protein [Vibrio sp.]|nr:DUF423 domain-containing protein [Vibrio sp.]